MSRQYLRNPGIFASKREQKPSNARIFAKAVIGVILFLVLAALAVGLSSCSLNVASTPSGSVSAPAAPAPTHTAKAAKKHHTTVVKKVKQTVAQQQAIRAAKTYLTVNGFSKAGLEGQLEFDKFSSADAKYAVNHIHANWNEQAARSAKNYLTVMGFSKAGLISQLEYDKYTHEQAVYGATQAFKS